VNLAALYPFDEDLPPTELAPPSLIQEVATRWIQAAAAQPELGLPVSVSSQNDAEQKYELVRQVCLVLRTIIDVVSDPKVKRPAGRYTTVLDSRILGLQIPPAFGRSIALTASGILLSEDSLGIFLRCLGQAGLDVWSMRSCPVCRKPYIPHRRDQKGCSPKCGEALRTRRARKRKLQAQAKS